ncbi:class Ib ribonucleoside-diphosphate reductase assembly flavoprotein NrdI [Paenibacillus sp. CC-CFT747]|nr:class Ib ribonucleoside-diphosphate reductase assembly flavoprotein NrdI [Paenibacillus sp. CC-CFT747]
MIAYASRTGNVRYIVSRLGLSAVEIGADVTLEEPFLLITYTDGIGEIPHQVKQFLESNGAYCRGVIVSGNSNFGHHVFGGPAMRFRSSGRSPWCAKSRCAASRKTMRRSISIMNAVFERSELDEVVFKAE